MTYADRLSRLLRFLFGPRDRFSWFEVLIARQRLNAGLRGES